jgi:uncharacterized RDD family membrane protein YckC
MKCPKCRYLGFETGDRCRNCGYDFSLAAGIAPPLADLPLHAPLASADPPAALPLVPPASLVPGYSEPLLQAPAGLRPPVPEQRGPEVPIGAPVLTALADADPLPRLSAEPRRPLAVTRTPEIPLFTPASAATEDAEPLVRIPTEPRRPLAVRRTPEIPRLKGAPRVARTRTAFEPRLDFPDLPAVDDALPSGTPQPRVVASLSRRPSEHRAGDCRPASRAMAAAIDLAILLVVDLAVLYLTLRMSSLTAADWRALASIPLFLFLMLLAIAYFAVFTALGGQTIGKMAVGIRVVADDGGLVPPSRAVRRTLAAFSAFITLGAAFAPALMSGGRALHDRLARTRVIGVPTS